MTNNLRSLNGSMRSYKGSFGLFKFVIGTRPLGRDANDVALTEWADALYEARVHAKQQMVLYVVDLFLNHAGPTARSGESDIFIPGATLNDCFSNQAAAGQLLVRAQELDKDNNLSWLVCDVTNEIATREHQPRLYAQQTTVHRIPTIQLVQTRSLTGRL